MGAVLGPTVAAPVYKAVWLPPVVTCFAGGGMVPLRVRMHAGRGLACTDSTDARDANVVSTGSVAWTACGAPREGRVMHPVFGGSVNAVTQPSPRIVRFIT